jgi:hypothetical protein
MSKRHHGAHPATKVKPSAVNPRPEAYSPRGENMDPRGINVNPSLPGPVGVETNDAPLPEIHIS